MKQEGQKNINRIGQKDGKAKQRTVVAIATFIYSVQLDRVPSSVGISQARSVSTFK